MKYVLDPSLLHDLDRSSTLEWLECNGRGGWAASTVTGLHTRRRHALLAALEPGRERPMVLLSKLDETLAWEGARHDLGVNRFPGAIHPQGHLALRAFEKEWYPVFTWEAGPAVLRKSVVAIHWESTTAVVYELLEGPDEVTLSLRPLVAQRDAAALVQANGAVAPYGAFEEGIFRVRPYIGTPEWFLSVPGSRFEPGPDWWRSFEYGEEGSPGAPAREDLFTYGTFHVALRKGEPLGVLVSLEDPRGRDAVALLEGERARRRALVRGIPEAQAVRRALVLAADALVSRGDDGPTILGGFPETSARPRDAAIAIPGILLVQGRTGEALEMIRRLVSEATDDAETVLWLFVAAHAWAQAADDSDRAAEAFLPGLRAALERLAAGKLSGVRVDSSGLLAETGSGERRPETNALWFNALSILAGFEKRAGDASAARALAGKAKDVKARWAEVFPAAETERAESVFALALPYGLLPKEAARRLLDALEERCLSPLGLRVEVRPGRPVFVPALLGAYATACVKTMGAAGKPRARKALEAAAPLLETGLLGHVPDACDAREPNATLGAAASVRATGELLRAWKLVGGGARPRAAAAAKKRPYKVVAAPAKTAVRAKPKSEG
jgi:glycogen debranching enzyme